jgi:membrane protease YdiL (CAAX protease family)
MEPSASTPATSSAPGFKLPVTLQERPPTGRLLAAIEVLLCSGLPTQMALALLFARIGLASGRGMRIGFVAPLLLTDTALLIGLILLFLHVHRESPAEVFFGGRGWVSELKAAGPMTVKAYGIAVLVLVSLGVLAPWLHTVEQNPLQNLLRTPRDIAAFAVVVVVAGGVREEVQRAFVLRRFELWLGGPLVGVLVSSVAFGAGHAVQGMDAAITTGLLGAFWAVSYLRRRSIIAPVVSHAAFDLMQIAVFVATGR